MLSSPASRLASPLGPGRSLASIIRARSVCRRAKPGVVGADPVGVLASLEAARLAPVLVVELSVHVAACGGVHGGHRKGDEDLMRRREWRRPNTPGRSDLDLICALRAVLPARGPASTASAGSREKATPIRTKVLTSIARCCGLYTIKTQYDVAQCGSCSACGRRVGTGAADRPALSR